MSASADRGFMDDPDRQNTYHGMSDAELRIAQRMEEEADRQQLMILERMGVQGLSRYTPVVRAKNLAMKQKGITIKHIFDVTQPDQGGWFFYEHDALRLVLGHPHISKDGRIRFNVREIL